MGGRRLYGQRGREYALVDYEVQGSAADFLKDATVAMDAHGYGELLRLTAHDELLAEVPREQAQEVLRAGVQIMTNRADFAVPITWDGEIMDTRWEKR
jgi:DNA polymerase-1